MCGPVYLVSSSCSMKDKGRWPEDGLAMHCFIKYHKCLFLLSLLTFPQQYSSQWLYGILLSETTWFPSSLPKCFLEPCWILCTFSHGELWDRLCALVNHWWKWAQVRTRFFNKQSPPPMRKQFSSFKIPPSWWWLGCETTIEMLYQVVQVWTS